MRRETRSEERLPSERREYQITYRGKSFIHSFLKRSLDLYSVIGTKSDDIKMKKCFFPQIIIVLWRALSLFLSLTYAHTREW